MVLDPLYLALRREVKCSMCMLITACPCDRQPAHSRIVRMSGIFPFHSSLTRDFMRISLQPASKLVASKRHELPCRKKRQMPSVHRAPFALFFEILISQIVYPVFFPNT